jgi:hypothetical protein
MLGGEYEFASKLIKINTAGKGFEHHFNIKKYDFLPNHKWLAFLSTYCKINVNSPDVKQSYYFSRRR